MTTTTQDKIREVLEEFLGYKGHNYKEDCDCNICKDISQALTRILELVEKCMPEEKLLEDIIKYLGEGYSRETYAIALQCYNQAIRDIKELVEKEKEKGG